MKTAPEQKGFLERAAWLSGANLLAFALSFLAPLVIVRVFSQSEFGTYKQLFQILMTAMIALYLQIPTSSYYFMPREPDRRLQVAMNIILFYALAGSVVAAVFIIFPDWLAAIFRNPALGEYVPLLGPALMLWLIAANVEVFPLALGDFRVASAFIILSQISKSVTLIGAAILFGSLRAVLWASIIHGAIQCALMLVYVHRRMGSLMIRPDRLFDLTLLKKQLTNSLPYGVGGTIQGVQSDLHNYFVSYFFSPAVFAVYANGCFQMPLLSLLQRSFRDAFTPEIGRMEAEGDYKGMIHAWLNAMRKLSFVALPACALMFILRYELITTLFTEAYAASAPIFSIYLINMLANMVLISSIMRTIADFRFFRLKLSLTLTPINFVALYAGVKLAGLIGVVTVAVSVHLLDMVICVMAICVRLGVKREDLKQLAPVIRTVAAVVVATMAAYPVKSLLGSGGSIVIMAVCGAVFGIVYVVAALALGSLTPEEKRGLYRRLRNLSQRVLAGAGRKVASASERL